VIFRHLAGTGSISRDVAHEHREAAYRPTMEDRFERLLVLRGHPVKGLPASAWAANLGDLDRGQVLRAVIEATRRLLLPEWESLRPDDKRPHLALAAAEAWLASPSPETVAHAKACGKACTAARNETFGRDNAVPEAARAIAWAAGANDSSDIWDALCAIETALLARIALIAEYQRAPQQRRAIVDMLGNVLTPKPEQVPTTLDEPVPYAATGSFTVGQRLTHSKFGNIVVTAAGDKWIDVRLEDGTTKRCAQKPKGA
jgi:hypothetical protein